MIRRVATGGDCILTIRFYELLTYYIKHFRRRFDNTFEN